MKKSALVFPLMLIVMLGCANKIPENNAENNAPADTAQAAGHTHDNAWRGVVLETMDSGGYTYILLQTSEDQRWIAGPPAKLTVGDKVIMRPGGELRDFTSGTLNRTFAVIYFVRGIELDDGHTHGPGESSH